MDDTKDIIELSVQRSDALDALQAGPLRRAEIESALDISRTTAHRILRTLLERGLVERIDGGYELTPLGEIAALEMDRLHSNFAIATDLAPFFEALTDTPFDLDVSSFLDAVVTQSHPGNPYAPVSRFMELLSETETLRGFDTTSIAPIYVDEIRQNILGGMNVCIIYHPIVVEQIVESYPKQLADAIDCGNVQLYTSSSLPCGLALFDERIGLGAYDDDTGMLTTFVDTDDRSAIEWGTELYESYLEDATPYRFPP